MWVLGYKRHGAIHVEASDRCPWNCATQVFSVTNTFGDISYLNTVVVGFSVRENFCKCTGCNEENYVFFFTIEKADFVCLRKFYPGSQLFLSLGR